MLLINFGLMSRSKWFSEMEVARRVLASDWPATFLVYSSRYSFHDFFESSSYVLIDGSLLLNARNYAQKGFRGLAISRDSGLTWESGGHDKTLIEPTCQASLIRYSDPLDDEPSRLLFSNPAHQTRRVLMTVRLSYDEGKTWPAKRLLHDGPSGYSCMTRLPEGDVGILFEAGQKSPYETIRYVLFSIAWLEAAAR